MTGIHGILLMATGVGHILFGMSPKAYQRDWLGFSKNKFWNQATIHEDRKMAAFWFLLAGLLFIMLGYLLYTLETSGHALPLAFGWMLLGLAVFGATMSHKSGFTVLLIPQAIYYFIKVSN